MSDLETAKRILWQRLESLQRAGVTQLGQIPAPTAAVAGRHPLEPAGNKTVSELVVRSPVENIPPAAQTHREDAEKPPLKTVLSPDKKLKSSLSVPTSPTFQENSMARAKPAAAPAADSRFHLPLPPSLKSIAERTNVLESLKLEVAACKLCKALVCNRTQTVFGVGTVKPRVLFFGEAPGADEDRQGEPFVGRSGQLLTKIIEACTFKREDVYILNTLKCRPPDNRPPEPEEVANCRPFWERQIEILQPEYVVCAGTHASHALLETDLAIGKLRGKFHAYRGIKVVCTYHPSYLLRNPDAKRFVWDDMLMLLKDMGIELPKK